MDISRFNGFLPKVSALGYRSLATDRAYALRASTHWTAKRATSREFFKSSLSLMCARCVSTVLGLRCNSFAI